MKKISTCYSQHAIKVSDSYTSAPNSKPSFSQNLITSVLNSVTCFYKSRMFHNQDDQILISLTWSNNLVGRGFNIQIVYNTFTCSDHLRKIKGSKNIIFQQLNGVEVKWDLSNADYQNGPEPISNFYVMISVNSKPILLIGDYEEHIMNPKFAIFSLISRTESFSGSFVYSTKAQFCKTGKVHEIVIKCGREENEVKDTILMVLVDKKKVVIVKRLEWNFRGNQCIFVDGIVVDLMWDVYEWLHNPVSGNGVFLFKTRSGFDNRLWLEKDDEDKVEFSLLVIACSRHPH